MSSKFANKSKWTPHFSANFSVDDEFSRLLRVVLCCQFQFTGGGSNALNWICIHLRCCRARARPVNDTCQVSIQSVFRVVCRMTFDFAQQKLVVRKPIDKWYAADRNCRRCIVGNYMIGGIAVRRQICIHSATTITKIINHKRGAIRVFQHHRISPRILFTSVARISSALHTNNSGELAASLALLIGSSSPRRWVLMCTKTVSFWFPNPNERSELSSVSLSLFSIQSPPMVSLHAELGSVQECAATACIRQQNQFLFKFRNMHT